MAKKLKKGLDQIFGDIDDVINDISYSSANQSLTIRIADIRPNPYQPRKVFSEEGINELAASIREHGVFQPIIVRKAIGGYELIAGERRLRASKIAEKEDIPAIVVDFDDQQMMEISLLENIQREDLNPIEEAEAYDNLIHKLDYTQDELAQRIGKSRPYITNMLRLLKLPSAIREKVINGQLSGGHARTLLAIESEDEAIVLAQRAIKDKLSVRELESIINQKKQSKKTKSEKQPDPAYENVRHIMENKLATKVKVEKDKIVITYRGVDDLNRILEIMDCLEQE